MELLNLEEGADKEGTIVYIKNNKRMRGANAWLLVCSIMIASLGLDLNSPAVIIGAMLISPLMAPILGVGLAVAINDRNTLSISLRHFGIAILIALITSTLYFAITPFGSATSEILSRTKPSLLDGLVAVFGGFAGIISTTRKEKSSAIPGVAIATALMPPLCVTGFGIANGNWDIMLNSFYLFFLNSFFIAITAFLIIRLLKFPFKAYVDNQERMRTQWMLVGFSLLLVGPSAFILYNLFLEQEEKKQIEAFISTNFDNNDETKCLDYELIENDTSKLLVLQLLGKKINEDSLDVYLEEMEHFGLKNMKLDLLQDEDLGLDQISQLKVELTGFKSIAQKLEIANLTKSVHELKIENLQAKLDSISRDTLPFNAICEEAKIIFPDINQLGFGKSQLTDFNSSTDALPVLFVRWNRNKTRSSKRIDEPKLYEFIRVRADLDTLKLIPY